MEKSKYKTVFLDSASSDLYANSNYISNQLRNVSAAEKLIYKVYDKAKELRQFPYANSLFQSIKKLKYDYRTCRVGNYILFYTIIEKEKAVYIIRIIYKKRNFIDILKLF